MCLEKINSKIKKKVKNDEIFNEEEIPVVVKSE
jgi:hypothetical protein